MGKKPNASMETEIQKREENRCLVPYILMTALCMLRPCSYRVPVYQYCERSQTPVSNNTVVEHEMVETTVLFASISRVVLS